MTPRPPAFARVALLATFTLALAGAAPATGPATAPSDSAPSDAAPSGTGPSGTGPVASPPSTRPTDGRFGGPGGPGRQSPFGNRMLRLRDVGLAGPDWPDTRNDTQGDDDWGDVSRFAAENFPNRWKLFQSLEQRRGDDSPLVASLKDRITGRYRLLMRLQRQMPDLFDAAVRQGRLEDDAWQAVIDARKQPKNADLNNKMKQKVSALVKNLLQERQDRLETLRQTLKTEQDRLDADRDDVDGLVDRQIDRLSGDDPGLMRGRMGGGGWNGFGGPGGPRPDGPRGGGGPRRDPSTRPAP